MGNPAKIEVKKSEADVLSRREEVAEDGNAAAAAAGIGSFTSAEQFSNVLSVQLQGFSKVRGIRYDTIQYNTIQYK